MRAIEETASALQHVVSLTTPIPIRPASPTAVASAQQPKLHNRLHEALPSAVTADPPTGGTAAGSSGPSSDSADPAALLAVQAGLTEGDESGDVPYCIEVTAR